MKPWRNDTETTRCARCGAAFQAVGRQRFCSAACRQAAWRRRHAQPLPATPTRVPRLATVYVCPGVRDPLPGRPALRPVRRVLQTGRARRTLPTLR